MPNRLIREGWLDSEAIARLSAEAERFFLRLVVASDDAGRFDGRPEILKSRLFPLLIGIDAPMIRKWANDCTQVGLVIQYEHLGKPYLQIARTQRCSPSATSRFPWRDGSHKIEFVTLETRDGLKQFVTTSLENAKNNPSASHADGIEGLPEKKPGTETETYTGTDTGTEKREAAEPAAPPPPFLAGDGASTPPVVDTQCVTVVTQCNSRPRQDAQAGPGEAKDGGAATEIPQTAGKVISGRSTRFVKPTPQEVEAYAAQIGYSRPGLGAAFCDFYAARGWLIGKAPMRDWKAAVRTWKNRDAQGGPNGNAQKRITGTAGYQPGKYAGL